MKEDTLVLADAHSWLTWWEGPIKPFEDMSVELLERYRTVLLAPGHVDYLKSCQEIFQWKRSGRLADTRLMLTTYKGRHIWSPENDLVVDRWAVHARSERQVLNSEKLVFVPLCLMSPREVLTPGDDGYLFMGGRKWRELDVGVAAMSRSKIPSRVISDFAPTGDFPGVDIRREKIPKDQYINVMERARVILVPLKRTPISHGHVDVITAILVGKPVIVTAGSSCDDYVQHGVNGLLVPDNSIEAWTDAIHEAYEKADDFAAAAREMAPRYYTPRYAEYIQQMVDFPDRNLIRDGVGQGDVETLPPVWDPAKQTKDTRSKKLAHNNIVRSATLMMRERRFAEALVEIEPCLDGPFRLPALRLKMRALMNTDRPGAEAVIRALIEEAGEDAELRTNLSSSLAAQRRFPEALAEARAAVGLDPKRITARTRLIAVLRSMRETDEAKRVIEEGLSIVPDDAVLLRMKTEIAAAPARQRSM